MDNKADRIIEVIERRWPNICKHAYSSAVGEITEHCLLGWMAADKGITLPGVEVNTEVLGMPGTLDLQTDLSRAYDLSPQDLKELQRLNDDFTEVGDLIKGVRLLFESGRDAAANGVKTRRFG